jgi:hypothetical protein
MGSIDEKDPCLPCRQRRFFPVDFPPDNFRDHTGIRRDIVVNIDHIHEKAEYSWKSGGIEEAAVSF